MRSRAMVEIEAASYRRLDLTVQAVRHWLSWAEVIHTQIKPKSESDAFKNISDISQHTSESINALKIY